MFCTSSLNKTAPNFPFQMTYTFLISQCYDLFCFVRVFKAKLRQFLFPTLECQDFLYLPEQPQQSPVRDRPVLCFFRGDLIDSSSLDTLCTRTGFILALKSLYYCTLATALVCQPQSVIVSPSVRTYYIVVCFTLVSLLILHILRCLIN